MKVGQRNRIPPELRLWLMNEEVTEIVEMPRWRGPEEEESWMKDGLKGRVTD